jgi:hypothetical protein
VKLRRSRFEVNERQQLILGILVIILLSISILYCLGLASLAARQAWENIPAPWAGSQVPVEEIDLTAFPLTEQITATLTAP